MLLKQAEELLKPAGYRFLHGQIIKNNLTYGFYSTTTLTDGYLVPETIISVRTCSKEVATVMYINNVELSKY